MKFSGFDLAKLEWSYIAPREVWDFEGISVKTGWKAAQLPSRVFRDTSVLRF